MTVRTATVCHPSSLRPYKYTVTVDSLNGEGEGEGDGKTNVNGNGNGSGDGNGDGNDNENANGDGDDDCKGDDDDEGKDDHGDGERQSAPARVFVLTYMLRVTNADSKRKKMIACEFSWESRSAYSCSLCKQRHACAGIPSKCSIQTSPVVARL